jgi:hypothetical protein
MGIKKLHHPPRLLTITDLRRTSSSNPAAWSNAMRGGGLRRYGFISAWRQFGLFFPKIAAANAHYDLIFRTKRIVYQIFSECGFDLLCKNSVSTNLTKSLPDVHKTTGPS